MSLLIPLSTYDFPEPETTREAERKIAILSEKVSEIADDLDDKSRRPDPALVVPYAEYMVWRQSAKIALRIKRANRAFLKGWLREHYEDRKAEQVSLQEAVDEALVIIMRTPMANESAVMRLAEVAGWKMEGFDT